jgi:hypothetical protein
LLLQVRIDFRCHLILMGSGIDSTSSIWSPMVQQ